MIGLKSLALVALVSGLSVHTAQSVSRFESTMLRMAEDLRGCVRPARGDFADFYMVGDPVKYSFIWSDNNFNGQIDKGDDLEFSGRGPSGLIIEVGGHYKLEGTWRTTFTQERRGIYEDLKEMAQAVSDRCFPNT